MTDEQARQRKSRLTILLLFAVFLAPGVGSWILYKYTDLGRDGGAASLGSLIQPPRTLENVDLHNPFKPEDEVELHRKWSLLYFTNENCDQKCIENVYRMQQIRQAVGKHFDRVQRVLLVKNISDQSKLQDSLKDYHGQLVLNSEEVSPEFINAFKIEGVDDPFSGSKLYIIDPLGNLMMSYAPDQNPIDIIKDLKRIFRVSRI
jgi:cytochrome oxidase Cu insertion factor (SCO1/SenC/PrrC family)